MITPEEQRRRNREHMRQYIAANREAWNERCRRYYANNKEKWQKYNQQLIARDRDGYNAKQRERYAAHAEKRREYARRYRAANQKAIAERRLVNRHLRNEKQRGYYAANIEAYRKYARERKKKETPPWVDRQTMRMIEQARPPNHHIDHVVPIKGMTPEGYKITGLNVPWNLQYLSIAEHRSKTNRMRECDLNFALTPQPVLHPSLMR